MAPLAVALAMVACGGASSGAGGSSATPAVVVAGAFSGSYTFTGSASPNPLFGAIPQGGSGLFVDNTGELYILPAFTSDGSASGAVEAVAPQSGGESPLFKISANAVGNPATGISGTIASNSATASFSVASLTTSTPAQLSALAGNYAGADYGLSGGAASVSITSSGSISGTDAAGCVLLGSVTESSGGLLVLTVQDGGAQPSPGMCAGESAGLAFESATDLLGVGAPLGSTGPFLYLMASNASNGLVLELVKQ